MFDIYQRTAHQKNICEDYVVKNDSMVILSDGCSTSEDTRIGAMLYCEVGLNEFEYIDGRINTHQWMGLAQRCRHSMYGIKVSTTYLDATVVSMRVNDTHVHINMCGDGLIFYKEKGKEFPEFVKLDFEDNTPLYPSYFIDSNRMELRRRIKDKNNLVMSDYDYANGVFKEVARVDDEDATTFFSFPKNHLEYMGIASDGVFSFKQYGKEVPMKIIFDHITAFKGTGEFMKRKMNHMFKELAKENIFNYDDFSIGVWVNDN